MIKVALCYYGNVGWVYSDKGIRTALQPSVCYRSVKRHIINTNPHVDTFVHSWSVGHTENILATIKPKKYVIEPQLKFPQATRHKNVIMGIADIISSLSRNIRQLCDRQFSVRELASLERAYSRWYSTKKVIDLKRQYEIDNGIRYDIVMLLRFDLEFYTDIYFNQFDSHFIYVGDPSDLDRKHHNYLVQNGVGAYKKRSLGVLEKSLVRAIRDRLGLRKSILWVQPEWKHAMLCLLGLRHYNLSDLWFFSSSQNMDKFGSLYENITSYNRSPHVSSYQHISRAIGADLIRFQFEQFIDYELSRCSKANDVSCRLW